MILNFPPRHVPFLLLFVAHQALGVQLTGKVTDKSGEPLAFATLYVEGTTIGTTTNMEGNYVLNLEPGEYNMVFQYVGYEKKIFPIEIKKDKKLNVKLESEALQLKNVVITADDEDPAYRIIRAAIKKRKYHLDEVNGYQCSVYMKGLQDLKSKPDQVFGYKVPVDTGIAYLSESISILSVSKPDKIHEHMISSKVSGNLTNFSYNQVSQMLFSFYDNLVKVMELSERRFVSPIASNALMFYDYKLEGYKFENDHIINRIRVTPRRKSDPVFEGYIYIIENSWKIHSVDLTLTKEHQLEFMNSLNIKQVFAPVQYDIWMLISQTLKFNVDAFGFKGEGNVTGIFSDYKIEPNTQLVNTQRSKDGKSPIFYSGRLFPSSHFSKEIMTIDPNANKKDNQYWNDIRPVPLTNLEIADYHKNDSLKSVFGSKEYKDSIDRKMNRIKLGDIVYNGYVNQNSTKERYIKVYPLTQTVLYNSIEGAVLNFNLRYAKHQNESPKYRIYPNIRYGFSSQDFYGQVKGIYYINQINHSRLYMSGGRFVSQFNNNEAISPFINSVETLVRSKNFIKLYAKDYWQAGYRGEITNGITMEGNIEYQSRKQLNNTSNYSFFDLEDFTPNQPTNEEIIDTSFDQHEALLLYFKLRFDFGRRYITRPEGKYAIDDSHWPRLEIYYHKGVKAFDTEINYDKISAMIAGENDLGLLGTSNYTLRVGKFLNTKEVAFQDFHHFNTNQSVVGNFTQYSFEILDYYLYSTVWHYYEAHYRHHFNGFIINKLPLIRKTKVQSVASLSYLHTPGVGNYLEYGIGLEHILKLFRMGIYTSTKDRSFYRAGFRIGMGF